MNRRRDIYIFFYLLTLLISTMCCRYILNKSFVGKYHFCCLVLRCVYAGASILYCDRVYATWQPARLLERLWQRGGECSGAAVHGHTDFLCHGIPGEKELHPQVIACFSCTQKFLYSTHLLITSHLISLCLAPSQGSCCKELLGWWESCCESCRLWPKQTDDWWHIHRPRWGQVSHQVDRTREPCIQYLLHQVWCLG